MKFLMLVEVAESPTEKTLKQIEESTRAVLRGHTIERIDIEDLDGVTRASILSDVTHTPESRARVASTVVHDVDHTYLFDVGNSSDGPIGYCARVNAKSAQLALDKLRDALPEHEDIDCYTSEGGVECCVYFNDQRVTVLDAEDEGETLPDNEWAGNTDDDDNPCFCDGDGHRADNPKCPRNA